MMMTPSFGITLLAYFLLSSSVIACWMGMLNVWGGIRIRSLISDSINMGDREWMKKVGD